MIRWYNTYKSKTNHLWYLNLQKVLKCTHIRLNTSLNWKLLPFFHLFPFRLILARSSTNLCPSTYQTSPVRHEGPMVTALAILIWINTLPSCSLILLSFFQEVLQFKPSNPFVSHQGNIPCQNTQSSVPAEWLHTSHRQEYQLSAATSLRSKFDTVRPLPPWWVQMTQRSLVIHKYEFKYIPKWSDTTDCYGSLR